MRPTISAVFVTLCIIAIAGCGDRRIHGVDSISAISASLPTAQREEFDSAILYLTDGQSSDGGAPVGQSALDGMTAIAVVALAARVRTELEAKRERLEAMRESARARLENDQKELREEFAQLGSNPVRGELANICVRARAIGLFGELADWAPKCAEVHLALAADYLSKESLWSAQQYLDYASEVGAPDSKTRRMAAQIDQLRERIEGKAKLQAKQRARDESKSARQAFGAKLREHFLDEHMDVKVSVSGASADQIKLTFVLFNDVWFHEFKKGSLLTEMRQQGFKRVTLTDGFDWGWSLSYD